MESRTPAVFVLAQQLVLLPKTRTRATFSVRQVFSDERPRASLHPLRPPALSRVLA